MKILTIVKLDHKGDEVTRYPGEVLSHTDSKIVLETHFARDDIDVAGLVLRVGDSFHETFYFRRWYNIFEIYDGDTKRIKGWYCNVGYPAKMDGDVVSYRDLALDLLVFPGGKQIVLDEDEFEDLQIPIIVKKDALAALHELQLKFKKKGSG